MNLGSKHSEKLRSFLPMIKPVGIDLYGNIECKEMFTDTKPNFPYVSIKKKDLEAEWHCIFMYNEVQWYFIKTIKLNHNFKVESCLYLSKLTQCFDYFAPNFLVLYNIIILIGKDTTELKQYLTEKWSWN